MLKVCLIAWLHGRKSPPNDLGGFFFANVLVEVLIE